VYAEAPDADVRAQAQAQLAQIMLAGDRLFLLTCRIRDYEERWEVYQETLVHALRRLPWLWDRFGLQADLALYLPLCLRTVLARRARQRPPVLVPLAAEFIDPAGDVETQVAHAECTALLWDLTTDLRDYVQAHASRWGPRAAAWFKETVGWRPSAGWRATRGSGRRWPTPSPQPRPLGVACTRTPGSG
jgi:hypothetical protein